jgi:hypothetical protein
VPQVCDIPERHPNHPTVRASKCLALQDWAMIKNKLMPLDIIWPKGRGKSRTVADHCQVSANSLGAFAFGAFSHKRGVSGLTIIG